jgi:hypothetical protein
MTGFSPHPKHPKHCELCRHCGGWVESFHDGESRWDVYTWCLRDRRVTALPAQGCAFWSGATDPPICCAPESTAADKP